MMQLEDGFTLSLNGLEELQADMRRAIKRYPNKAEEALERSGKEFKQMVVQETKQAVKRKTGNLIKGYKVDPVTGYGINMETNFRGTAPHFHLLENGHEKVLPKTRKGKKLKNGGKNVGFVPGRLMVHATRKKYAVIFPEKMKKVCDEILRESGLT